MLITQHGFVKVADMGLAEFVIGKTYTTCGTLDYFAPELIVIEGHTNAVDWWTLASSSPSSCLMQIYFKSVCVCV